jgi:hypothetical protein
MCSCRVSEIKSLAALQMYKRCSLLIAVVLVTYCLFEALRYKPEGRGFDSRGVIGIFH